MDGSIHLLHLSLTIIIAPCKRNHDIIWKSFIAKNLLCQGCLLCDSFTDTGKPAALQFSEEIPQVLVIARGGL